MVRTKPRRGPNDPVISSIKIGRKIYEVKKGDYILYNQSCYQFYTGDNRTLRYNNHTCYRYIMLPYLAIQDIPLHKMKKIIEEKNLTNWILEYYFF